jgi:hypothetical protein
MGTNFYRIPSHKEMVEKRERLEKRFKEMELSSENIERGFHTIPTENGWEYDSPWSEFLEGTNIHLGKRSSGWKFLWNFNNDKYYKDKESLLEFMRSGRIVNEYSEELDVEEFIEMSLSWGEDDGWDLETYYKENPTHRSPYGKPERYVDGLRISDSVDFS